MPNNDVAISVRSSSISTVLEVISEAYAAYLVIPLSISSEVTPLMRPLRFKVC